MNAPTVSNSKPPRKQLSDQIDRLDGILDALSEGLNGAVADAAREGTRQAVKDAIIEIMTDPTLRARLHESTAPEPAPQPPAKPGFWSQLKARAAQAVNTVGQTASQLVDGAARGGRSISAAAAEGVRAVRGLGSLKNLALVGVGVGLALGVTTFLAPHAVAAAVAAVSGAVAAAAVQVGVWTRRAFRTFRLA